MSRGQIYINESIDSVSLLIIIKKVIKNLSLLIPLEEKISIFISYFNSKKIHWAIIGIGIIVRVIQFLYNRSFTEGEAALALNIVQRSYSGLFKPLDYVQAAPVGFLILQKFAMSIFGNTEYALRLFPLVAGIISLFIFFEVAKKTIHRQAVPIALILFSVGDHLIYFASEVKQYSGDVAIALLLILLTLTIIKKDFQIRYIMLFGFVGAVSVWFSHPTLFTFGAGTIVILMSTILRKKWKVLFWSCIAIVIAIVSLGINYSVSLESLIASEDFSATWHGRFLSFPQVSLDIQWFGYVFLRSFKFPVGLSMYELFFAVVSFFVGCIIMLCKKKKILLILLLPIVLTLVAAQLQKYPFEGRLLLFITPSMILIIAEGLSHIQRKVAHTSHTLSIALVTVLLIYPIALAGYHVIRPRAPEELRPVMAYINQHYQTEDVLYVYYASVNAFRYYSDRFTYIDDFITGIESRFDWLQYDEDLRKLKGNKRVWVVFSHVATWLGVDEEKLFLAYLDRLGTQEAVFKTSGASCYLYDLSY